MNSEKNISKAKKNPFVRFIIIFLCILLVLSWCFTVFYGYTLKDSAKPQTVKGTTAKKIERLSSDFMSYLCDLDFKNASECLDHQDMADNLTSELTKKAVNSFSDSFLYETSNFEELRNSASYAEITQKTLDFIKENSSYEITGIKKEHGVYYVSVLFNCIESSDLLSKFFENTNYSNATVPSSPAVESEEAVAETSSSSEIFAKINNTLDTLLLNTEKEEITITLEVYEKNDKFKISDLTDMNFIKFFIQ